MKISKGLVNWFLYSGYRHTVKALGELERDSDGVESEYNKALRMGLQGAFDYSKSKL